MSCKSLTVQGDAIWKGWGPATMGITVTTTTIIIILIHRVRPVVNRNVSQLLECLPLYDGWNYIRCDPMPTASCPMALTVGNVETLKTIIESTVPNLWSAGNAWSAERIAISPDLQVNSPLSLDASNLASLGVACTEPDPSCEPIRYANPGAATGNPITGVSFGGTPFIHCLTDPCIQQAYPSVEIRAGVTVRFAFKKYYNGGLPGFPVVEIFPPCPNLCGEDTIRCPFDGRCYEVGVTMCLSCKGAPQNRCACIKPVGGQWPEGSTCQYINPVNQDVQVSGTCIEGVCTPPP